MKMQLKPNKTELKFDEEEPITTQFKIALTQSSWIFHQDWI